MFITGRNEVVAKVIFLHLFVILFTGGGFCLNACWDTNPPRVDTPLGVEPPGADPPRADTPPWEQNPPQTRNPPRPGTLPE